MFGFTCFSSVPVCAAIVNFKHGDYFCDHDNHRGSTCTFQCEEGYYLNTTNTTTCLDDGSWSFGENMPECFRKSDINLCFQHSRVFVVAFRNLHR